MTLSDVYQKICRKMLEIFPEKTADVVYHYTSVDVLWEFLKPDYDFCCTFCRELSDPREFRSGMFACTRMMREWSAGNEEKFLLPLQGAVCLAGDSDLNLLPWTMSFSTASDETYQWEHYVDTGKGGCAVGFDVDKLSQDVEEARNLSKDSWGLVGFLPCIYDGVDKKEQVYQLFDYAMKEVANDLAILISGKEDASRGHNTAQTLIFLLLSSLIKHKDFREEKEWRLVFQPLELSMVADSVEQIGGKTRIKTGLWGKARKVSDRVERIIVSPQGPSKQLRQRCELFAALRGLRSGENSIVVTSESPYRGTAENR